MATKIDPKQARLAREFQQTAAFAKKLAKPITVTLHLAESSRGSMEAEARQFGITLDSYISIVLGGGMSAHEENLEWVLEAFRDDADPED